MASDQRLPKRLTGQERPNSSSLPICPMQKIPSIAARDSYQWRSGRDSLPLNNQRDPRRDRPVFYLIKLIRCLLFFRINNEQQKNPQHCC